MFALRAIAAASQLVVLGGSMSATGGIRQWVNGHWVHTFYASDTFEITEVTGTPLVQMLVVGGGGGGGRGSRSDPVEGTGGGGGAGGAFHVNVAMSSPQSIAVTVGTGGSTTALSGGNSIVSSAVGTWTAYGGGTGNGSFNGGTGLSGGSGGGGAGARAGGDGIAGQGFPGGTGQFDSSTSTHWGAHGGGAGGPGGNYSSSTPGAGLVSSITGLPITYAQGGYKGSVSTITNTFGGGGTGGGIPSYQAVPYVYYSNGTTGKNGIVVIKYPTTDPEPTVVDYDREWNSVVLQLSGDGANNATNNTITDGSPNAAVVTRVGKPTPGSFAPYLGWGSIYFGGGWTTSVLDYLSFPPNEGYAFGSTDDFTIDAWIYIDQFSNSNFPIWDAESNFTTSSGPMYLGAAPTGIVLGRYGPTGNFTFTGTFNTGVWYHVRVVRQGTTTYAFQNGKLLSSTEMFSGIAFSQAGGRVGFRIQPNYCFGFISNLRLVKGTALTTSSFVVGRQQLTAIPGTQLLLLGKGSGITDVSGSNNLVTYGNSQISSTTKHIGTGALALETTGDKISSISAANTGFTSARTHISILYGDFTIECWIYPTAFGNNRAIVGQWNQTNNLGAHLLYLNSSGVPLFSFGPSSESVPVLTGPTAVSLNTWTHLAVTRTGTTFRLFVNGSLAATSGTISVTSNPRAAPLSIGNYHAANGAFSATGASDFTGYIDELRISRVSRYTASFIPSTLSYYSGSLEDYVEYLVLGEGPAGSPVIVNTSKRAPTGAGSAGGFTAMTNTNNYVRLVDSDFVQGASALAFPGTSGQGLSTELNTLFHLAMNYDWSIDFYVKLNRHAISQSLFSIGGDGSDYTSLNMFAAIAATGHLQTFYSTGVGASSNTGASGAVIPLDTWTHIAYTYHAQSRVFRTYINGVWNQEFALPSLSVPNSTPRINLGRHGLGVTENFTSWNYLCGYMDQFRVSRYKALFNSSFTPGVLETPSTDHFARYMSAGLHFDGVDQSTTITDVTGKIWTANGNAQLLTAEQKFGTTSAFFGNGGSITTPASTAFGLGTGDFTAEAWVYFTSNAPASGGTIFDCRATATAVPWTLYVINTGAGNVVRFYNASDIIASSLTVPLTTWTHIALTRLGSTVTLWINGVEAGTATHTTSLGTSNPVTIGNIIGVTTAANAFPGYIDDARILKGVARYVRKFDPPTESFDDQASTSVALHMNGTNGSTTIEDVSSVPNTFTANGVAVLSTAQKKFGTASGFFANGGSFTAPESLSYGLNTGNFTIECWVYMTSNASATSSVVVDMRSTNTSTPWIFFLKNTGTGNRLVFSTTTDILTSSLSVPLNEWTHIAAARYQGQLSFWINGEQAGLVADVTDLGSLLPITIGNRVGFTSTVNAFPGYIDDLRIVKGAGKYNTVSFKVPTSAFNDDEVVSVGMHMDGANGGTSFPAVVQYIANGAAKLSTAQKKFGTSSAYFADGGSFVTDNPTATTKYSFGTGDFTIEAWMYMLTPPAGQLLYIFDARATAAQTPWVLYFNSGSKLALYITSDVLVSSIGVPLNSWTHVAVTRSGTTMTIWVNGVSGGSVSSAASLGTSNNMITIGNRSGATGTVSAFPGYIDEARLTKGIAFYTAPFTPPTAPFPNNSGASLLLHMEGANEAISITDDAAPHFGTANGAVVLSTAQKKFGTSSAYFANGGSITFPQSTNYSFGTGDFTVEAWVYMTANATSNNAFIFDSRLDTAANPWVLYIKNSGSGNRPVFFATTDILDASTTFIKLNTWTHIAVTRFGTNMTMWVDGIAVKSITNSTSMGAANMLTVGNRVTFTSTLYAFPGYIDDARVTKRKAHYPIPLVAPVTEFDDQEYRGTDQYQTNTVLSLHMNGDNGSTEFIDTSASPKTVTANGDARHSTADFKFNGSSGYFDGTGDFLSIPNSTDFQLGTGDFTFEVWIKYFPTSNGRIFQSRDNDLIGGLMLGVTAGTGYISLYVSGNTSSWIISDLRAPVPFNVWNHFAVTRKGSLWTMWVNGVAMTTTTSTTTVSYTAGGNIVVGGQTTPNRSLLSYMNDMRLTKGVARYTSNFDVPTQPFADS